MTGSTRAAGTPTDPVLAAGVLLWAGESTEPRFLLLQNARHSSWGFPKGHADAGDADIYATALREVAEETGYELSRAALHPSYADSHAYQPTGEHWKRVVHFLATEPVDPDALRASDEHADVAWLTVEDALERLAHPELQRALVRADEALSLASA